MSCQALWTALAVTYLMCVLILSGIQKEDLDANVLQKLQRHNVNIEEMNNEELRRNCKGLDVNLQNGNLTTESYTEDKNNVKTDKSQYKNAVPYEISHSQVYLNPIDGKEKYELESNIEKTTQIEAINKDIEYYNGKPKLESILNFWDKFVQNYKRDSITLSPSSPNIFIADQSIDENLQKNKRDVRNDKNTNESEIINKMITNFLLEQKNLNTDRPSTQGFLFENVYEDILSPKDGIGKRYKEDLIKTKSNIANTFEQIQLKNYEEDAPKSLFADMETEEVTTHNSYMSFKDILAKIDQKTAYPFLDFGLKNFNNNKNIEVQTPKVSNDNLDSLLKPETNLPYKYPEKETSQSFSSDIIKDIAESVKALVLKDLRNEVRDSTTQTTTATILTSQKYTITTTEKGTTQPKIFKKENTVQDTVLSKFLELFEQIKSLKNNPVVITQDNQNTTEKKELGNSKKIRAKSSIPNNGDNKVNISKTVSTTGLHTIKQPYVNTPIFNPMYNDNFGPVYSFGPQIHKFRSSPVEVKEKNIVKSYISNKKLVPITFQTNALEIPPLGVYLDKPQDPINQNIIVTTLTPQRAGHNGRYTAYNSADEVHNDANSKYVKNFGAKPNTYCSTHDCTWLQRSKSRHNVKSSPNNDESKYTYHKNNLNRFMTYTDPVHIEKEINVPRYYEKLENMDEELSKKKIYVDCCEEKYTNTLVSDCCNRKIASRQQISLNPIKRGFDDTHFKNFLKSQQKVTDMLKRILAVKNKIRSVEHI